MIGMLTSVGLGGRVPDSVRNQLQKMIASGITVPSLSHYLQ